MKFRKSEIAESIPFDNDTNGFVSEDVQAAIEEVQDNLDAVALPGFSFGRSGNAPDGSWLLNNEVPSNLVGVPVGVADGEIVEIWAGSENVDTYDLEIYEHQGDEIGLTLLTTVSVIAARTQTFTGLSISVTTGEQISVKIVNGNAKNPKCFILVKGTV